MGSVQGLQSSACHISIRQVCIACNRRNATDRSGWRSHAFGNKRALLKPVVRTGFIRKALQGLEFGQINRSEEHTSELQSLMRISYAVFCLKKKRTKTHN